MKTIDMTPSWETITVMCLEVITNPLADREAKDACKQELFRLARTVDQQNAELKAYNEKTTTVGELLAEQAVDEILAEGRERRNPNEA